MKKNYFVFSAVVTALVCGIASIASSNGPSQALTNSPIGNETCNRCHSGTVNAGPGSIQLSGLPTDYVPGTTYSLTLSITGESSTKLGFQTVALNSANANGGSFNNLSSNVGTFTASGATFIEHTSPSATGTWTFDWTAPTAGTGDVSIYTAINATNNNGNTSGDRVYNQLFSVSEAGAASVANTNEKAIRLFPNPATDWVLLENVKPNSWVSVYNLQGQQVFENRTNADQKIELSSWPKGTYFMVVEQEVYKFVKR